MSRGVVVRRSNLVIPASSAERVFNSWRHDADAVTIDLRGLTGGERAAAHRLLPEMIEAAGGAGSEVFLGTHAAHLTTDVEPALGSGLAGVVLAGAETVAEIQAVSNELDRLEAQHGVAGEALDLIVTLGTAVGAWHAGAILAGCPRISQASLNEPSIAHHMGFVPDDAFDPFKFARDRLTVESTAVGVAAIGMSYPLSMRPRDLEGRPLAGAVTRAKLSGMRGVLCPYPGWIATVNKVFTPSEADVAKHQRVLEVFADGVAAGTAAVPLDGRMVDVPVAEYAKDVLALAAACSARDHQKRAARQRVAHLYDS